jgi:ABC-type protease/lipase transport system fused ATPase/permease subunit
MDSHLAADRSLDLSRGERGTSLRHIRPLVRIVWGASPPVALATVLLRLTRALIPAATLWISNLILDAVVGRISRGTGTVAATWKLVALELALAVASASSSGPALPTPTRSSFHQNINFYLEPSTKLSFIGENRTGKATLAKLLADSAHIAGGAYKSLAENVIDALPRGHEQMVRRRCEGGVNLSRSQRQNLAIARTQIRDTRLLILDEPTARLNAPSEYEVLRRFIDLTRGRIAVPISHTFSAVRMADRIIVPAAGSIPEQDTHYQLVARGGRYAELLELQAAGYR